MRPRNHRQSPKPRLELLPERAYFDACNGSFSAVFTGRLLVQNSGNVCNTTCSGSAALLAILTPLASAGALSYSTKFLQDVEAVRSVQDQLATFRREMARDGKAQRSECRKLIAGAIKRAQKLIDDTLQVRRCV